MTETPYTTGSGHQERFLQDHGVAHLVTGPGSEERSSDDYDRALALDRAFIPEREETGG